MIESALCGIGETSSQAGRELSAHTYLAESGEPATSEGEVEGRRSQGKPGEPPGLEPAPAPQVEAGGRVCATSMSRDSRRSMQRSAIFCPERAGGPSCGGPCRGGVRLAAVRTARHGDRGADRVEEAGYRARGSEPMTSAASAVYSVFKRPFFVDRAASQAGSPRCCRAAGPFCCAAGPTGRGGARGLRTGLHRHRPMRRSGARCRAR